MVYNEIRNHKTTPHREKEMRQWKDFLRELEPRLGSASVQKWLSPLKVVTFDARNLYLEAENYFQVTFFEEHVRHLVTRYFVTSNNKPIHVHISYPQKKIEGCDKKEESDFRISSDPIDPLLSFASFVSSEKNQISLNLLAELIGYQLSSKTFKEPTLALSTFNPIYLYGPPCSGKTHLLMACGQRFSEIGIPSYYVKAKTFTDHVIQAIRLGRMQEFRKIYREVKVLLIDDIEDFADKNATQEELFHTFNTLYQQGSQIILSSFCPPQKLVSIEPRLISRFEWGITLPLFPLEKESIKPLLRQKQLLLGLHLPDEGIDYIAEQFPQISKWQKALEALTLQSHLEKGKKWTLENIKNALQFLVQEASQNKITADKLIKMTAESFEIKQEDLLGTNQTRECSIPRQIAMYLCKKELGMPFTQIGKLFDRDHSTVMSAVKKVQEGVESKIDPYTKISEILTRIADAENL